MSDWKDLLNDADLEKIKQLADLKIRAVDCKNPQMKIEFEKSGLTLFLDPIMKDYAERLLFDTFTKGLYHYFPKIDEARKKIREKNKEIMEIISECSCDLVIDESLPFREVRPVQSVEETAKKLFMSMIETELKLVKELDSHS